MAFSQSRFQAPEAAVRCSPRGQGLFSAWLLLPSPDTVVPAAAAHVEGLHRAAEAGTRALRLDALAAHSRGTGSRERHRPSSRALPLPDGEEFLDRVRQGLGTLGSILSFCPPQGESNGGRKGTGL